MTDNCIDGDTMKQDRADHPQILIADPESKLKLVKWRLTSDGFNILYTNDMETVSTLIGQNDVGLVMVNVANAGDLKKLNKINSVKGKFGVIAFTAGNNIELKKQMFASGVNRTLSKPIDFPKLSKIVKEEIQKIRNNSLPGGADSKNKGYSEPLGFLKAYKTILDHVKTAVLMADRNGIIVSVNRPMTSLLQMNEGYLLDKHYRDIIDNISDGYRRELLAILQKVLDTTEAYHTNEIVISNVTDSIVPIEAEARPVFDNKGKFMGAFLTVGETSGSGQLERAAAQSEKLAIVGQLAAGAVHEIKNPLTSVRGFIQLLQSEVEGSPKAEYFSIIIDEIDRVNTIVNEFLKLAKPAQPNRTPSDLRELWKDIRVLMESEAFLRNVKIKENLSDNIKPVLIDCEQIKQVLINVVRNSFEAMGQGGELTVRLYEISQNQKVCLEISDNGEGMDEETVRRIFVPFFTTKDNGTGLGLSVSHTIMENHGGCMKVKSETGRGTTTLMYFPYE